MENLEENLYIITKRQRYKARHVICKQCGKVLLVFKNRKHCGYCQRCNCKQLSNDTRIKSHERYIIEAGTKRRAKIIKCSRCGKELFLRKNSKQQYCISCTAFRAAQIAKEKNLKTGVKRYRRKALTYFYPICCCCEGEKKIIIHHIDLDRNNNSIDNLMPLCQSCHVMLHYRLRRGLSHETAFKAVKTKKTGG